MFPVLMTAFTFPLPQNSTLAPQIDTLYNFIYWVSVASLVPTIAAMLYFAIKYREGKNLEPVPYIHGNAAFEWTVSTILSIVFVVIFVWGLVGFNEIHSTPEGAYEINVIGQQWMWSFQYANGKTTTADLYVPRGVPVKLIMTSRDVIHDFYVPNFRLKQDVVPGMYTTLWFEATQTGENDIFCAQYCGTAHSNMLGKVVVLEPDEFKMWLNGQDIKKINVSQLGAKLFEQRNCVACHSVNGATKVGPSLKGLFGSQVTLADGSTVSADENYIRDSIMNPSGQLVKGFNAIMPTFKGLLTEEETNELVAYIKSLKE
jgi:cytochrome c oxidase subunit II